MVNIILSKKKKHYFKQYLIVVFKNKGGSELKNEAILLIHSP